MEVVLPEVLLVEEKTAIHFHSAKAAVRQPDPNNATDDRVVDENGRVAWSRASTHRPDESSCNLRLRGTMRHRRRRLLGCRRPMHLRDLGCHHRPVMWMALGDVQQWDEPDSIQRDAHLDQPIKRRLQTADPRNRLCSIPEPHMSKHHQRGYRTVPGHRTWWQMPPCLV